MAAPSDSRIATSERAAPRARASTAAISSGENASSDVSTVTIPGTASRSRAARRPSIGYLCESSAMRDSSPSRRPSSIRISASEAELRLSRHGDVDLPAVELAAEDLADGGLESRLRLARLHGEVEEAAVHAAGDDLGGPVAADRPAGPAEPRHAPEGHGAAGAVAAVSLSPKYCMSWSLR